MGARIVAARLAKGLTQAQLAREAESQNVTVYRHEKGLVTPSLDAVVTYARLLEVSVEWIMHGGPGGPVVREPATSKLQRVSRQNESGDIPLVVAQLWASGKLGEVTPEEIAFLARHARQEEGATEDDLELALLARRAATTRAKPELEAFNRAVQRQAAERGERSFDLKAQGSPSPDTVRKSGQRKPPKR